MPVASSYLGATAHPGLGPKFADPVSVARFPMQVLRFRNQRWAERIGLATLSDEEWLQHFASFDPLPDNLPRPLALRYHGHQFDSYNPELGDGRGFLFAQLRDDQNRLLDLGTKGSGTTPYSRAGDGRLTLKGGVREVLATEMLEALGVYTSKTLSLIETGEHLERSDEPSPTRSSVLVRLSHSHVRIGTFQRLLFERDHEAIQTLVDHCLVHYSDSPQRLDRDAMPTASDSQAERVERFYTRVIEHNAVLCAQWMNAGFVHGVLNSDNMTITGESFDYGPYRFLPHLDPDFTAAYFDRTGLYCYGRQPTAVAKNLARLGNCLVELGEQERLQARFDEYMGLYERAVVCGLLQRLGVRSRGHDDDQRLYGACLDFLLRRSVPFAQFFFDWYGGGVSAPRAKASKHAEAYERPEFASCREQLQSYEPSHPERLDDEYFQGIEPCDLLIDEIETIWSEIDRANDFGPFEQKVEDIRRMGRALGG